jgi:hypothetical protein
VRTTAIRNATKDKTANAKSIDPDKSRNGSESWRVEGLLDELFGPDGQWRLMRAPGAKRKGDQEENFLFALSKDGTLYRFASKASYGNQSSLDFPQIAALADQAWAGKGVLANVAGVLVILGASDTRDKAYNPRTNQWSDCGHDPNLSQPDAIAYRGGNRPRLWAISAGTGKISTLAVDSPRMFARDYFAQDNFLQTRYLAKTDTFEIMSSSQITAEANSATVEVRAERVKASDTWIVTVRHSGNTNFNVAIKAKEAKGELEINTLFYEGGSLRTERPITQLNQEKK